MALAALTDVADRLGRDLTAAEQRQATALLDDATDLIIARFPAPPATTGLRVCAAMVVRVLRNPEGRRSATIDDFSYTIDSALSAGELYITEVEANSLRPKGSSSFSIEPSHPDDTTCPPPVFLPWWPEGQW